MSGTTTLPDNPLMPRLASALALMERESEGLLVQVFHLMGETGLRVVDAGGETYTRVPSDKVLDAFAHPYVYR